MYVGRIDRLAVAVAGREIETNFLYVTTRAVHDSDYCVDILSDFEVYEIQDGTELPETLFVPVWLSLCLI